MDPQSANSLGADLRALRRQRGLTLQALGQKLGRSVGWLSQVERNLTAPSITDLRHMADCLDIPVSSLFGQADTPAEEQGVIVRARSRRSLGSRQAGLVEDLLSPDLTDAFEMVHCDFAPHSRIGEPVCRATQELGYVISGRLDMIIGGARFALQPGDSFRIRGELFEWVNPYDEPARAIWVIAPPIY